MESNELISKQWYKPRQKTLSEFLYANILMKTNIRGEN